MNDKANAWIVGDDTGSSSKAIWAVMMRQKAGHHSYPSDGGDLGRCLRLLEAVPEWKPRIGEMAAVSPYWAALVKNWDRLRDTMAKETGPDFAKRVSAPRTYQMMKEILDPIEDADRNVIRMGAGATLHFGR